jgi:hypothetical protein
VPDEIITPEMAITLHAEALARRELPAWIVFRDEPDYPGKVIARFVIGIGKLTEAGIWTGSGRG